MPNERSFICLEMPNKRSSAMASVADFINGLNPDQKTEALRLLGEGRTSPSNSGESGATGPTDSVDDGKVPRLPNFSGAEKGSEVPYRLWKFEVEYLSKNGYPEHTVQRAIHRSVRGMAADVLCFLGQKASSDEILKKFETMFGNVADEQTILSQFHSAKQQAHESITSWGCRLEGLLADSTSLISEQKKQQLRSKFWDGLRDESVKNAIRHRYDNKEEFSELLSAARALEKPVKASVQEAKALDMKDLEKKINEMSKLLSELHGKVNRQGRSTHTQPSRRVGPCHRCGEMGHLRYSCPLN